MKRVYTLILILFFLLIPITVIGHLTADDKELITSYVKKVKKEIIETRDSCDNLESSIEERIVELEKLTLEHEHGRIK